MFTDVHFVLQLFSSSKEIICQHQTCGIPISFDCVLCFVRYCYSFDHLACQWAHPNNVDWSTFPYWFRTFLVSTLAVVLKRASFVQAWKQSVTVQPPSRILLHFIIACISNKLCAIPGGAYPKSFPLSAHFLVWYDFNEINRWPHTANIKSEARGSTTSWLACCRSLQV